MSRRPPGVDLDLEGGSILVRGTLDLDEARKLAEEELIEQPDRWWDGGGDIPTAAREYAANLQPYAVGWHRKAPCFCGGGHSWDVIPATEGARGAFPGMLLEYRAGGGTR
jgi:hypothetical protein